MLRLAGGDLVLSTQETEKAISKARDIAFEQFDDATQVYPKAKHSMVDFSKVSCW